MVNSTVATLLGVLFLAVPLLILGLAGILLTRLRRARGIEEALVNLVLHPRSRRRLLTAISMLCGVLVAGLVVGGLMLVLPGLVAGDATLLLSAVFLLGTFTVLWLELDGLANSRLTLGDRMVLGDTHPELAEALRSAGPNPELARERDMYVPPSD